MLPSFTWRGWQAELADLIRGLAGLDVCLLLLVARLAAGYWQ
jgi:hypothetical protein